MGAALFGDLKNTHTLVAMLAGPRQKTDLFEPPDHAAHLRGIPGHGVHECMGRCRRHGRQAPKRHAAQRAHALIVDGGHDTMHLAIYFAHYPVKMFDEFW